MWIFVIGLLVWAGGAKVEEADFERLKGFYPHQRYLLQLDEEREKGLQEQLAAQRKLDVERESGLESYRREKALSAKNSNLEGASYKDYLKDLEGYENKKRQEEEAYTHNQVALQKRMLFEAPVTLETELGLANDGERVAWEKRKTFVNGMKSAGSSGSGGGSRPSSGPSFDSSSPPEPSMVEAPPPPDIPEFDTDLPPPPPPPGEMFDEAMPPPFDDAPDF